MTTDQLPCDACGDEIYVPMLWCYPHTTDPALLLIPCPECLIRKQDKLNAEHAEAVAKLIAENTKLREETQELNDLFDLQQTRMHTATKKWQEATGNPGIFPDLGRLLDWLLTDTETNDG